MGWGQWGQGHSAAPGEAGAGGRGAPGPCAIHGGEKRSGDTWGHLGTRGDTWRHVGTRGDSGDTEGDRDTLQHLERQALEAEERQDLVPFTGEKKGKPFVPKRVAPELPREEQVTLEPELEEALANATEAEMCDIAAILGMYTLMSNKQYYDAICSGDISNTEGINSVVQPDRYRPVPDEPPNPTDVAETLQRLQNNDPELQDVNLNNIKVTPPCHCPQGSPRVTRGRVPPWGAVAEMLEHNRSLQSLNLESNFITSAGMLRLLGAVGHSPSLRELRVDNQCQRLGDTVEMAMAATLEQCPSLLRLGYTFTLQGPRARAAAALTRNSELRECHRGHRGHQGHQGSPGSPRITKYPQGSPGATRGHQGSPRVTKCTQGSP
uniref:Tropomodulin 4 n=1 Tax=Catharus ustulatus TaxID=91951 RepID=A0A8C3UY79_CATUS